ncbi:MAG: L,D-transpeptidase family protein [Ottowia sp.]|uniref:L,D-transpeptidase family protein n=1 Tax=Ottowia sp. TaxID=1898956 RepID=UPI003C742064
MFLRKQLWQAVVAATAITMGAVFIAPAQAAVGKDRKPKAAVKSSAKSASKSAAKSRSRAKKAVAAATAATAVTPKNRSQPLPNNAEARLLGVIELIEGKQLDAALQAAAKLTADVPNFQAAQLVYADLLRFKTGKPVLAAPVLNSPAQHTSAAGRHPPVKEVLVKYSVPSPAAASPAPDASAQDWQVQLRGLRDELRRRVQSANASPPAGSVPHEFTQLGASVRYAMAIDASRSRLYLFSNEGGKLRLKADYYISVGKLGTGKALEGDQRTPEGVYFIGRQIPGPRLPEFYGKGALTMNYPNEWDKSVGRSGDGIWLHGSPPDQFARLPEASDGCVVLANPDLISLMKTVDRQTPVLIRDKIQWTAQPEKAAHPGVDPFLSVMDTWQQAWKRADQQALAKLYSPHPLESLSGNRIGEHFQRPEAAMKNISVYAWKDAKGEIRIVDLQVSSKRAGKPLSLRQYWRKAGNRWEIFSETVRG